MTVGSDGQVHDLELDDRVHRLPGRALSRAILTVMRTAQRRLADQVAARVESTVGADTETGRAVVAAFDRRFPPHEEEPADER